MAEQDQDTPRKEKPARGEQPIPDTGITAVHGDGGKPRTPGAGDPAVTEDPENAKGS